MKRYPKMTFVSTGYEGTGTKACSRGTLTLHGVSRTWPFDLVHIGEGKRIPGAATAAASTPPPPSSAASSA